MSLVRSLFTPPTRQGVGHSAQVRESVIGPSSAVAVRSPGVAQLPDWEALTAVQQGYLANYVVYRCVQINARKIASLPFRAGRVAPDPGEAGEANPNAELALKLGPPPGGPNPDTAPSVLWTHSIAQRQVTGRFAWEIEHNGKGNRPPTALWPLISQYLRPVPAGKGDLVDGVPRYFTRYEYNPGGQRRDLAWNQVYYDWVPSQYDWHQPESPLQAARLGIGAAVLQDLYDTAFLKNGGVPAYVVVTQAFEDPEMRERFRAQFNAQYQGATKAGKTAFAETLGENASASFNIETIGMTAKDSQALEKYRENLEGIAITLGVPWGKLSTSNRTFSNADTDDLNWELDTIVPLCVEVSENINIRLAPMFGSEVGWFDLSSLKCFQKKKQYTAVSPIEAHAAGEISLNEARVALGEDPIDGGDDVPALVALNEPEDETPTLTSEDVQSMLADALKALPPASAELPAPKEPMTKSVAAPAIRALPEAIRDTPNDNQSRGVIAAFWLTPEQASELAVPGYEPPEIMHVTLAYLGKVDEGTDRQAVDEAIASFAQSHGPITASVSGTGQFDTPDGIAVIALLDSPDLMEFRSELVQVIERAGATVDRTHDFTPHITLAYVDSTEEADGISAPVGYALEWNRIVFAWGPERTFYPLTVDRAKQAAAMRAQLWHSIDAQAVGIENTWEKQLEALIGRQERAVMANLKGKRARQAYERAVGDDQPDVEVVYDKDFWTAETAAVSLGIFSAIMAMAAGNTVRDIGALPVNFALTSAVVVAFLELQARNLANQITDTTFRTIQEQLTEGIKAGESIPGLADRLRGLVGLDPVQARALVKLRSALKDQVEAGKITQAKADWLVEQKRKAMLDYRLSRIAKTETIPKYSAANALIAKFYPSNIVAGTGWLSAHDSHVRPEHRIADGQQRRIGQPFDVGPYLMMHPGDMSLGAPIDQLIQCRCTTRLLTPAEFEERAENIKYIRVADVQKELTRIALGVAA